MLKAIETRYKGYRFRAARSARFEHGEQGL